MIYKFFLVLILLSNVAYGQNSQLVLKPILFVDSLFGKEDYTAEILDIEYPKEITEILTRFQKFMQENKTWIEEYMSKNYVPGEGLPYHERFNVTREEYQKIKNIKNSDLTVVIKDSAALKITRFPNVITFTAVGDGVRFLESVQIDLKNGLLLFLGDTIPFDSEVNTPASNAFGQWYGYGWKKEISNLGEKDEMKVDSLISKIVIIEFGRVSTNNKLIVRLKYKEVYKGEAKANFDRTCYLF